MRVGVVGTGYLGRLHARVLNEIAEADLVGFVEPNDAIASEVAENLRLRRFDSVASLAREIECAVVATPTTTHFKIASELLQSNRDVLIEKPITTTVDEAWKLIDLAAAKNRIIQVGHVERYNPAITAVASLLNDVRYVEAERLGVFVARSLDIDVLLDLMIHDLNLVLSLLQQKVAEIRAVGVPVLTDKVDITNVRLELENGAVANLTASRVSQERVRKVRFFSSDSYISVDTKEQEVKGYRLTRVDASAPAHPTADAAAAAAQKRIDPINVTVIRKEPLRAELEAFLRCVADRSRPIVAGEDGLEAVALAARVGEAIDESMRRWRR